MKGDKKSDPFAGWSGKHRRRYDRFGFSFVPHGTGEIFPRERTRHVRRSLRSSWEEYKLHTKQHVRTAVRKWFPNNHLHTPLPLAYFDNLMNTMKVHLLDATTRVQLTEEDEEAVLSILRRLLGDIKMTAACVERDARGAADPAANVLQLCRQVRAASAELVDDLLHVLVKDGFVVRPARRSRRVERRPTFDYSIFGCVLLWRHCRHTLTFTEDQQAALERLQRLADFGVRGMATYHACVEALSVVNQAFRNKDDAIYRAATARNTIPDTEVAATYNRLFKQMTPGDALEISTADLAWLDNDAFALLVTDLAERKHAFIGPRPRGCYQGINIFPLINPYCNFYRSKSMGVRLTKALPLHHDFIESCLTSLASVQNFSSEVSECTQSVDSGAATVAPYSDACGVDVTISWSIHDELGLGGKMFWGPVWGGPVAASCELYLFMGIEEMLMRRSGREAKQSITFAIPADETHEALSRLCEGDMDMNWLQDAAMGGSVNVEKSKSATFVWNKGIDCVAIGIGPELIPGANVFPKNIAGVMKCYVNFHKRAAALRHEIVAGKRTNTETSSVIVDVFKRQTDKKTQYIYMNELQFIYPMKGLSWAPAAFLQPMAGGFTYRHLQPMQYRIWERIDSVQHHATAIVIYPRVEEDLSSTPRASHFSKRSGIQEVTVVFTVQKARESDEFPLADFHVDKLAQITQDEKVAAFLEEADQAGQMVEVECVIDQRLVQMCWEDDATGAETYVEAPKGRLNKDRLMRALQLKKRELKVRRIMLSDTQEKYRSRFTWALLGYCRFQQTEAGLVKPTRRSLEVEYDHFGAVARAAVRTSENSTWTGTSDAERDQMRMVELWTAA